MSCLRPKRILTQFGRLALVFVFVVPLAAGAQTPDSIAPEARDYLEHALRIMQERSINRTILDWDQIRAAAFARAAGARDADDTHPAIRDALASLGDGHSLFRDPPPSILPAGVTPRPLPAPKGRRVRSDLGYIRVPGFGGPDPDAFAEAIRRSIREADGPEVCGWVVDVRGNGGGDMWPMLNGIAPILGDGVVGYFVPPEGGRTPWVVDRRAARAHRLARPDPPVAVLHDHVTASSGEAVVVAFRGRRNTRSFGHPTRGLSTANASIRLPDGATMLLTVSVLADRDGNPYGSRITPDDGFPELTSQEEVLTSAVRWLQSQPGCAGSAG